MLVPSAPSTAGPRPTGRMPRLAEATAHVFLRQGKRGGVWYAKYRPAPLVGDARSVPAATH